MPSATTTCDNCGIKHEVKMPRLNGGALSCPCGNRQFYNPEDYRHQAFVTHNIAHDLIREDRGFPLETWNEVAR